MAKKLFGEDEVPKYMEAQLSEEGKRLAVEIEALPLESIRRIYRAFSGVRDTKKMRKQEYCIACASLLDFKTQGEFDAFFLGLSPLVRDAIAIGAFYQYVPIAPLEQKYKVTILSERLEFGYERVLSLNEELRLDLFHPADVGTLYLPALFRKVFSSRLPAPPERNLTPVQEPVGELWSNVEFIREAAPLMGCMAVQATSDQYLEEFARKGLSKTDCRKYRAACGQVEFPIAGKYGLDSLDLFARIAACIPLLADSRVKNGDDYLRKAVEAFLNPQIGSSNRRSIAGAALEYLTLIDHLSRRQGYYMDAIYDVPPSRTVLKGLLLEIGKTQSWYGVKELHRALLLRDEPFYFIDHYNERMGLLLRCTSLTFEGIKYSVDEFDAEIPITGRIREAALGLPLLKAYCYVLALLGVVELVEAEPEASMVKKTKAIPLSPYDAVSYIRVSEFGAWCLGLTREKPQSADRSFEAIADKELLLVTFRGKSIERRLYLEGIGEKLGEERYRITEASFIRGCESTADISKRINSFKRLIDPNPSSRWTEFFESVSARAGLFSVREAALLYTLPKNAALAKAIVSDPILRPYIIRTENGRIAVRAADERKFRKALREAGYFEEE